MNRFLFFILFSMAVVMPQNTYAQAADLTQTRAALAQKKKEEAQSAKARAQAEKKLKSIQSELTATARQSQSTERKLNELQNKRKKLEQEQAYLAERLIEDQGMSTAVFRALYQTSRLPAYGLYFSKTPKDEIIHKMIALNTTLPSLHQRMRSLGTELKSIRNLQKDIDQVIKDQQNQKDKLAASSARLKTLAKKRESLYQQASASYKSHLKEVKRLQKEAKSLEDLLSRLKPAPKPETLERTASRNLPAPPAAGGSGRFMPVVGTIKIKYGETDEIGGKNQGLVFSTQPQAVAVSPMAGKVVFAGPFQNFKRLLIIEHNGGYHSLVAGLDHIETDVGADLQAGEPVGRVERSSGGSGRVYFELRKNGKPVNPSSVIKT